MPREPHLGVGGGIGELRLRAGERRALELLELRRRERRLAQRFGHERERRQQVFAPHLDGRALGAHRDARVQLVERLLELAATPLLRAAQQHLARELARHLAVHERFLVAPMQRQVRHHAAAARLLRQERELDAVGRRTAHEARLDVLRGGVECLAQAHALAALVVRELCRDVRRRRDLGALGVLARHEESDHAVRALEIVLGDALHVRDRQLAQLVAIQEKEPPVADRCVLGERAHELAAVELRALDVVQEPGARMLDLLGGDLVARDVLHHRDECLLRPPEVHVLRELGTEVHVARIVELALGAPGARGDALLHERAVQPPGRRVAEDLDQHVERRVIGMAARHRAVERHHHLLVADALQGHAALAVLRRLIGVERGQGARGLRHRPEMPCHALERARLVEMPGNEEHGVIGLVPRAGLSRYRRARR